METGHYEVRVMTLDEVSLAIDLAATEGWNPGIYDAECFYAADPHGFLVGLLDGEPVSSISAVKYGKTYSFMGFYVVRPGYRGKKLGLQIGLEGMKYLEGRDIGLDGVLAQVENYKRAGFVAAHHNARYQGEAAGPGAIKFDRRIVPLADIAFKDLQVYDDGLFMAPRHEFLRAWIDQPECTALGIVENGQLAGYSVLRKCRVGYKIGPLFADNAVLAEALYQAVSGSVPCGTPIFLDVPGETENPAATELTRHHDMKKVFETVRMYRMCNSPEMNLPLKRWFGITTFELG